MAKWNGHRGTIHIATAMFSKLLPLVTPASALAVPNDFTALVNTAVRFEPPPSLSLSLGCHGGVIKSQIAHLSSQLFARNFHVTKAATARAAARSAAGVPSPLHGMQFSTLGETNAP